MWNPKQSIMSVTSPTNDENDLWVKVTKPVSCIVKGLRLKGLKTNNITL
jgi:hypothetical protein